MRESLPVYRSALLTDLATCLNHYRMRTPGMNACVCVDVLLPGDRLVAVDLVGQINYGAHKQCEVPQGGSHFLGVPNFVLDIHTSDEDYEQRRAWFEEAGVIEYVCVKNGEEPETTWNRLIDGSYQSIDMTTDDAVTSEALPGFWIPKPALRRRDWWTILAAIEHGVTRREHHALMQTIWS